MFIFTPIWGRFPFWLYNIFQMGWNHQPEKKKELTEWHDLTKHTETWLWISKPQGTQRHKRNLEESWNEKWTGFASWRSITMAVGRWMVFWNEPLPPSPRKRTWQWKMYFLLNMVIFQCLWAFRGVLFDLNFHYVFVYEHMLIPPWILNFLRMPNPTELNRLGTYYDIYCYADDDLCVGCKARYFNKNIQNPVAQRHLQLVGAHLVHL